MAASAPAPRGIVQTPLGGVHYVTSGSFASELTPILAFHMSPRSTDEYKEAMVLLSAGGRLVVAIDELGYGCSDNPHESCTLEQIADGALLVANALGISSFIGVGSLMGCFFASSLASRFPERVKALVLTNVYHFPEDKKKAAAEKAAALQDGPIPDDWAIKDDGTHLVEMFDTRKSFLDPVMNTRVVSGELIYKLKRQERYAAGVSIQDGPLFDFEKAGKATKCPTLCISGKGCIAFFDMIGYQMSEQLPKVLAFFEGSTSTTIEGSINCLNTNAEEWYAEVARFLASQSL